jgi:hypothetical protein
MTDDPSQDINSQDSGAPRPLSPWNPLDHLRLLWWVLVTPQQLKAYRKAYGENAERRVGSWLTSTFAWLPLFILALALGLGTTASSRPPSTAFLVLSLVLVPIWTLTGWFGKENSLAVCRRSRSPWNRHGLGTSSFSSDSGHSTLNPRHSQSIGIRLRSYPASCSGLLPRILG